MPVDVQFSGGAEVGRPNETSFDLQVKDGDRLSLPNIFLIPRSARPPLLSRISISVTGSPAPLVELIENAYKGFHNREFFPLFELTSKRSIIPNGSLIDLAMLKDSNCVLEVALSYQEPPADAEQQQERAVQKQERFRCYLHHIARASATSNVSVIPPVLRVVDGKEAARLTIRIDGGDANAKPRLRMKDPNGVADAALRDQLLAAFERISNQATLVNRSNGVEIYEVPVELNLQGDARADLIKAGAQAPAIIQMVVELAERDVCEFQIKIEPAERVFPGYMAMDFGTSSSTVTLWDFGKGGMGNAARGLSAEQKGYLRRSLLDWFNAPLSDLPSGVRGSEWETFRDQINDGLKKDGFDDLITLLSSYKDTAWHAAVRQVELTLGNTISRPLRQAVSEQLYEIYHASFRAPSLVDRGLIPVAIDADKKAEEIPSELEIKDFGKPLQVEMGHEVRQNRKKLTQEGESFSDLEGRFHQSPKAYLRGNQMLRVNINGRVEMVSSSDITQAAWAHLIKLTEKSREVTPNRISKGLFKSLIVTYPAVSPPTVRRKIESKLLELNIDHVRAEYDEATAAAIFYLWQEFSGALNIGLEGFKVSARHTASKWIQNVLVVDIGGGSTDVALLRISLEEVNPFKEGESCGAGGRYYVITPELVRSSGNLQLGGELITLRTFLLLKARLADQLLTLVQEKRLESAQLAALISELPLEHKGKNDEYLKGSLFARVYDYVGLLSPGTRSESQMNEDPRRALYDKALEHIDRVIPTSWRKDPVSRLQTFYTLWDCAEEAKFQLGARQTDSIITGDYQLSSEKVAGLLNQIPIDFKLNDPQTDLGIVLTRKQFESAALPLVEEMSGIAQGVLDSYAEEIESSGKPTDDADLARIDWLILSGKSCNLDLIDREFHNGSVMRDYLKNVERITFVPKYAKLATSIGAAFIERARQLRYEPEDAIPLLRDGVNQFHINVKNLFWFLPCSFVKRTEDPVHPLPLFEAGRPMLQLDSEMVGKARSEWDALLGENIIDRVDFKGASAHYWGRYNRNDLEKRLGRRLVPGEDQLRIQFEVNHELSIRVFICDGDPYYLLEINNSVIDLSRLTPESAPTGTLQPGPGHETRGLQNQTEATAQPATQPFSAQVAGWDIAVQVAEGGETIIFKADTPLDKAFFDEKSGKFMQGAFSAPLPRFPASRKHLFFARRSPSQEWLLIGALTRPGGDPMFLCDYYASLDETGLLRVHAGCVPYWTTGDVGYFQKNQGCVYVDDLQAEGETIDKDRDPFCGEH